MAVRSLTLRSGWPRAAPRPWGARFSTGGRPRAAGASDDVEDDEDDETLQLGYTSAQDILQATLPLLGTAGTRLVKRVNLRHCSLGDATAGELDAVLRRLAGRVSYLDLRANNLADQGLFRVASALLAAGPKTRSKRNLGNAGGRAGCGVFLEELNLESRSHLLYL